MNPSNKKLGNLFEKEFCEILGQHGFWVHNLTQNASGQPADVIAVRNGLAYLIDCKVCTNDKFALSRIEENQCFAMSLWEDCGNPACLFAFKTSEGIYIMNTHGIKLVKQCRQYARLVDIKTYGETLEEWLS